MPSTDVLGLLEDDGPSYPAIYFIERQLLLNKANDIILKPILSYPESATEWQYGNGEYISGPKKILGSFNLTVISDSGNELCIRLIVLNGLSQ